MQLILKSYKKKYTYISSTIVIKKYYVSSFYLIKI